MNPEQPLNRIFGSQLEALVALVAQGLNAENREEILGKTIAKGIGIARRDIATVRLAFLMDTLKVAEAAIFADNVVSPAEAAYVLPLAQMAVRQLGKLRPDTYKSFAVLGKENIARFLATHRDDPGPFGSAWEHQWLGLEIAARLAKNTGDQEVFARYELLMTRLMDELLALDGVSEEEKEVRQATLDRLALHRPFSTLEAAPDARIRAFLDPGAPEVFHDIVHANQVWQPDIDDVESIHDEARQQFMRWVDRLGRPGPLPPSRLMLLLGESGSGKTHLLRAFRTTLHRNHAGYATYFQLSRPAEDYSQIFLEQLLQSWERPYLAPEIQESGLIRLSDALAEAEGYLSAEDLRQLREGPADPQAYGDLTRRLSERLAVLPPLAEVDPELIRALLYLQARDPILQRRIAKYLRGDTLSMYDRSVLGWPAPPSQTPIETLAQLSNLVYALGQGTLVFLVDQLEDLFSYPEENFRRAFDTLRAVADHVPRALIIIACLDDLYVKNRNLLSGSLLDRLEREPPVLRLPSRRSADELAAMIARRLQRLYEFFGVRWREEDPIFPFQRADLERIASLLRPRDILDWCRRFHIDSVAQRTLVTPVPERAEDPPPPALDALWSQYPSPPVPDDAQLIHLLGQGLASLGTSNQPEGEYRVVVDNRGPLLIGVCNREARGNRLKAQLDAMVEASKGRKLVLVRSSDFPASTTVVGKKIGEISKNGGRKVVIPESDWATIAKFQGFIEVHKDHPELERWLASDQHPLRPMASLNAIFGENTDAKPTKKMLPLAPPVAAPPAPPPATQEPPKPELKPSTEFPPLNLGRSRSLVSELVTRPLDSLRRHAAFLGSPGSGKTTLALNVIEQALLAGVPALLLDRKGDLAGYADDIFQKGALSDPGLERRRQLLLEKVDVRVYTPGNPEGAPLFLNIAPSGIGHLPSHLQAQAAIQAAEGMASMLVYKDSQADRTKKAVLGKAIETLAQLRPDQEIRIEDIVQLLNERDPIFMGMAGQFSNHFDKLTEHLETLRVTRPILLEPMGQRLDAPSLFGLGAAAVPGKVRLAIVSTRFLGDNAAVDFWVSRLLSELLVWIGRAPSERLQALLFLDEADIYLPVIKRPATKAPLMALLKQARSAGLGILLATQSPGDLDYVCREQILSWFLGRVTENNSLRKLEPQFRDAHYDFSSKLPVARQGEFVMTTEGRVVPFFGLASALSTQQLSEDDILRLARRSATNAER